VIATTTSNRYGFALQVCLFCVLVASVWWLLLPEPQFAWAYYLRLCVLCLSTSLACGFWLADWRGPRLIKYGAFAACLATTLLASIASARNFDAAGRILERAQVRNGRIVHAGIGLSYPLLANFAVDLTPTMTRSLSRRSDQARSRARLQLGEVANVCQMIEATSSKETGHGPAWIVLEVQRGRIANLNTLIRDVRREEAKWAELPNFTITRRTHLVRTAGFDSVEFEFVKEPQNLRARQVYLRTDVCVLHFLLNTEVESDLGRFDEFVNSIQLE
jgi:hypothetical protein